VFDVAPARAYFPIGHDNDRHAPPLPVEYVPALHVVHCAIAVLATGDDLPAAQFPEQAAVCKPAVDPYVPAGQSVHAVPASEYLPAAQSVHAVFTVLPAGDDLPAAQDAQTLALARILDGAPATAYFPAGQVNVPVHVALVKPAVDPYVPAGQSVHAAPASEYLPAAQSVHCAIAVLPAGDDLPAAQDAQTVESVRVFVLAPARAYLPTGQVNVPVQEAVCKPAVDPYVPAGQLEQVVEPAVE
jgi:hypothetical protein